MKRRCSCSEVYEILTCDHEHARLEADSAELAAMKAGGPFKPGSPTVLVDRGYLDHQRAALIALESERARLAFEADERRRKDADVRRELAEWRERAEKAERKFLEQVEAHKTTLKERDEARSSVRLAHAPCDAVWFWEGSDRDDPASLSCPVVMSAETLREFVAAKERLASYEAPK